MVVTLAACGLIAFAMDRRFRALAPAFCAAGFLVLAVLKFPGWNKLQLNPG